MIVIGTAAVERYFATHAGDKGIRAARSQYDVWLAIAGLAALQYRADVVVIRFFGSHAEYDQIDAERV
jgi:mRNA interferase HigB